MWAANEVLPLYLCTLKLPNFFDHIMTNEPCLCYTRSLFSAIFSCFCRCSHIFAIFCRFSPIFADFLLVSPIFSYFCRFSPIFADFLLVSPIFSYFCQCSPSFADFLLFLPVFYCFRPKIGVFLKKNNAMIQFLHEVPLFWTKDAILKIISSAHGFCADLES
jgi:hypothetical protein